MSQSLVVPQRDPVQTATRAPQQPLPTTSSSPQPYKNLQTKTTNNNHQPTAKTQVPKNTLSKTPRGSSAPLCVLPNSVTTLPTAAWGWGWGRKVGEQSRGLVHRQRTLCAHGLQGSRGSSPTPHICQPPGPAASRPSTSCLCFSASTLPAGYVRGEECRATLCHEIRLTFLG